MWPLVSDNLTTIGATILQRANMKCNTFGSQMNLHLILKYAWFLPIEISLYHSDNQNCTRNLQKYTPLAQYTLLTIATNSYVVLVSTNVTTNHLQNTSKDNIVKQETPLPLRDRALCYISWNLVNCGTTVRKNHIWKACSKNDLNVTQVHQHCLYSIGHTSLPIRGL